MFWAIFIGVFAVVALVIGRAFLTTGKTEQPETAPDLQVYRDQLAEIDRDVARGVLNAEDAERTRLEVKRRALDADKMAQKLADPSAAPKQATQIGAALALVVMVGIGFGLYARIGAPGYSDLPLQSRISASEEFRASRPDQLTAEAEVTTPPAPELTERVSALLAELRSVVAERPDDVEGHRLLAAFEPLAGNYRDAYRAKQRQIELLGDTVSADDYAELTELLVVAAGGYVSPEAEAAITAALELDAGNGLAVYYYGLLHRQIDRPDLAFGIWQRLEAVSHPDAPWLPALQAELPLMAELAGTRYTPPAPSAPAMPAATLPGPSADDIAAAQDMSEEDRQAMIRGMVEGLADRLANDGGTAPEWARLIAALGTLGEFDRAKAIYDESQQVFAGNDAALQALNAAAARIGLIQ